jgi:hypothetical protein
MSISNSFTRCVFGTRITTSINALSRHLTLNLILHYRAKRKCCKNTKTLQTSNNSHNYRTKRIVSGSLHEVNYGLSISKKVPHYQHHLILFHHQSRSCFLYDGCANDIVNSVLRNCTDTSIAPLRCVCVCVETLYSNNHKLQLQKILKAVSQREANYQLVMRNLVKRYIAHEQRKKQMTDGVNEDDINEIKQDISSFRYELLDILQKAGFNTGHDPNSMKCMLLGCLCLFEMN